MSTKIAFRLVLPLLALISFGPLHFAAAQETPSEPTFKTEELDQMLAPIALYPDDLLSNVLMASTYPLDVVQAARWRKEPANAKLKGDALSKAVESKAWDPSVKALTQFPDVLQLMSDKLEWTQKLGDAFLAQEDDVFARIQFLRQKAEEAGNLESNEQQKVSKESDPETKTEYIVIEPAQTETETVYVPVYQPSVVYGSWWYPNYPPYYWNWYPGAAFVRGFFWGAGYAVARELWGWGHCDWHRGNINIDIDRYNNINRNRVQITDKKWAHNPKQRGPVPYRDKATRDKFGKGDKFKGANKDFRGYDKDKLGDRGDVARVKDKLGEGSKVKDKVGEGAGAKVKDKVGDGAGAKVKDKAKDRPGAKAKDKAGSGKAKAKTAKKDIKKAPKSGAKAMNVKPKKQVKQHSSRGKASRKSAASHRSRGGGGGGRGGGGRRR